MGSTGMSTGFVGQSAFLPQLTRLPTVGFGGSLIGNSAHQRRHRSARRARTVCSTFEPLPTPPPKRNRGSGKRDEVQDYVANVGAVIDALRADYPRIPEEEPSLALYSDYVTLRSPAGVICQGRASYRGALWLTRTQLKVFFAARSLMVLGLYHDRQAGQVYVRWRFSGVPRVAPSGSPAFIYDGLSIYTLNDEGLIRDHLLDNVQRVRRSIRPLFESVLSAAAASAHLSGSRVGRPVGTGVPSWCEKLETIVEEHKLRSLAQDESKDVVTRTRIR